MKTRTYLLAITLAAICTSIDGAAQPQFVQAPIATLEKHSDRFPTVRNSRCTGTGCRTTFPKKVS